MYQTKPNQTNIGTEYPSDTLPCSINNFSGRWYELHSDDVYRLVLPTFMFIQSANIKAKRKR